MTEKKKVLLDPSFRTINEIFHAYDLARLSSFMDVVWGEDEPMPEAEFEKVKPELTAIISGRWRYGNVQTIPHLRAILEVAGQHPSPQELDFRHCFAKGIRILSCAPAFGPMVAEMALGSALACNRNIVQGHNDFSTGTEIYLHEGNVGCFSFFKQKVGLIGFGSIARSLKSFLDPFDCQYLVYDPWLPDNHLAQQGVIPTELEAVMETAKVIFVSAIPSLENQGFINRSLLAKIQKGATVVFISRASVVDFDALTELVLEGRFNAAIDVFPNEPLEADHPIRQAKNTVLSAHRAGSLENDLKLIGKMVVDDLESVVAGIPPMQMQSAQPELLHRLI